MTITFDGVSSRHKAILMCDGILEQNKWVTFWPCHPSWSWLMGSLDAVMRRTLPLSRRKRHFELIEGIHDHKILGDEAQYGFSHDVAYYVEPFLFLTLATSSPSWRTTTWLHSLDSRSGKRIFLKTIGLNVLCLCLPEHMIV